MLTAAAAALYTFPTVSLARGKNRTSIRLSLIGDIMCHDSVFRDAKTSEGDYDFSYIFKDIRKEIKKADLAIGNLETTFAGDALPYRGYPCFNTPEHLADDLRQLGVDVVSTANNHCMDSRYDGLVNTLKILDREGIAHTGTSRSEKEQNRILIKKVKKIKIAFLSFTYGTNGIRVPGDKPYAVNFIDEALIKKQLKAARKKKPDLICVSMHWGTEYQTKENQSQEKLADLLIRNGAGLIIGCHPHVLQPIEQRSVKLKKGKVKKGLVIYSLGNFMSGQVRPGTRTSVILKLKVTKNKKKHKTRISDVDLVPIYTYKKPSGSHRIRLLNLRKAVSRYKSGQDRSVGKDNYDLFKKELDRMRKL